MTTTQISTTEHHVTAVVDAYFDMWNEPDPARIAGHIRGAWDDEPAYVDPMFSADSTQALESMVAGLHAAYPGHVFVRTDVPDAHHDRVRWGWQLVDPAGAPIVTGVDYAVLAPDGRLKDVTGFYAPTAVTA